MESQEPVQHGPLTPGGAAPPSTQPVEEEGPVTLGQWFSQNGVTLGIVLALLVFLFYKFDLVGLLNILKAFLGLSLVVLIHEMGHLLAAKWCDVKVTSFSLGFGPTIPGCSFKWGETTYKFSLIPLGGYVQMVGQVDGDEAVDGTEDDPRSYRGKTVGQRMLIISAGVIMNVILAVICFVLVFRGPGKDRIAPTIAGVDTSSPSFQKGIRTGSQVMQIDSHEKPNFEDLMYRVRGTLDGDTIHFEFKHPQWGVQTLDIEPLKKKSENPMIGLRPSEIPEFRKKKYLPGYATPTIPLSAASEADPGFTFGDRILAVREPAGAWTNLQDDPRHPDHGKPGCQKDYFQFLRLMQDLAGKDVEIKVGRDEGGEQVVPVKPSFGRSLGVRMGIGPITSLRKESSAEKNGIVAGKEGQIGDVIQAVEVDSKGHEKTWSEKEKSLNPETLPYELRKHMENVPKGERKVKLHLLRHVAAAGAENKTVVVSLNWDDNWKYDQFLLIYKDSPLPIPELGLAYRIKTSVAEVTDAKLGDAENKLQKEDWIKKVRFHFQGPDGKEEAGSWIELFETKDKKDHALDSWAFISDTFLNAALPITKMELEVDRNNQGKEIVPIEIVPQVDKKKPLSERGFLFMQDIRNERAESIFGAIGMGMRDTQRSIVNVFSNLRGLVLGRLPVDKNLGGPARIGEMAYRIAGFDLWEFIFFLGLISINLAVVNFLPIPVLDGGHMVFLLYEKFRGKPASEGVRIGATYAGLAIILCLMGFVIFLDISHYLR